jgi:vacuolar protein sorting-associated protein 13A/C
MIRSIATSALRSILKNYAKGFNEETVKFSISGELQLDNIELHENVLEMLDLPLVLKRGVIGQLKLVIPWTDLGT